MMLCLKAEAAALGRRNNGDQEEEEDDLDYNRPNNPSSSPLASTFLLPLNISNTIQRYISRKKEHKSRLSVSEDRASLSSTSNGTVPGTPSSGLNLDAMDQDVKACDERNRKEKSIKISVHKLRLEQDDANTTAEEYDKIMNEKRGVRRARLEEDIKALQKKLDEETDLHLALASASDNSTVPFSNSLCQLPDKAQDLLADIDVLEITVSKLEEEKVSLQFQLSQERNERHLTQYRLRQLPSSPSRLSYSPISPKQQAGQSKESRRGPTLDDLLLQTDVIELDRDSCLENFRQQPNQLSEEMVRCMRDIFLCLADSFKISSPGCVASPASPKGHLSFTSIASLSDSSAVPASKQSPSSDSEHGGLAMEHAFDPYRVEGKLNWRKFIGTYSTAAEVSWMSVGEKQLEYASGAFRQLRLLVEQLAKVSPACMNTNERLAFWINLYNTLMMHAYLAYGVPTSENKFFSLMKKAAYTVGGISVSAADIEYIILKMKAPTHRPHIALVLGLHKFKLTEEKRKYAIENSEPIVAFALSCGMHSSPAVRIFRPETVMEDLQRCLKDYIQAAVGMNNKGKLLVPKLLHCYTKGIVEESMLPDWICRFLSPEQAAIVRDCSSHHKQRLLSPRSFTVQSFDSTFRYLFLPDDEKSGFT